MAQARGPIDLHARDAPVPTSCKSNVWESSMAVGLPSVNYHTLSDVAMKNLGPHLTGDDNRHKRRSKPSAVKDTITNLRANYSRANRTIHSQDKTVSPQRTKVAFSLCPSSQLHVLPAKRTPHMTESQIWTCRIEVWNTVCRARSPINVKSALRAR